MKKKKENPEATESSVEVSPKVPASSTIVSRLSGDFPIEDIVKAFVYLAGPDFHSRLKNIDGELGKLDGEIASIEKKIAELEDEIRKQKKMLEERRKIRNILQAIKVNLSGGSAKGA